MIAAQIILIAVGALLAADADECCCSCNNKRDVCEEQNALRKELDENTAQLSKWNRHYNFVRGFSKDWRNQVTHVVRQQLEVERNSTVEVLESTSQKEVSILKEDLIARIKSLENSMRALHERADEFDLTMEMISEEMSGIRNKLHPIQREPKCGVDFDNDGSNGGGNISSVLVWPWIAAVFKEYISGPEHRCDGSVIHRRFVMTSAWCVKEYGSAGLSVKLGLSDLEKGTHLQESRVRSARIHPQFKRLGSDDNYDYNMALLELEEPIKFGPFVRPVCLPPREIPVDDTLYRPQSTIQSVNLREYISSPRTASPTVSNLTILPLEECRRKLRERGWENSYPSPDIFFCTESSSTACPISGSPLVQSQRDPNVDPRGSGGPAAGPRTWTQVGISSGCHERYFFTSRLDHLRAWVDATIADSSKR